MNTAFATAKALLSCRRRPMISRHKLSIQEGSKVPAAEGGGQTQGISRQWMDMVVDRLYVRDRRRFIRRRGNGEASVQGDDGYKELLVMQRLSE
jgi:hypothetical protein